MLKFVCQAFPFYVRTERLGKGVTLYIREDITGDVLAEFDNGTCEMILVFVHQLNTVVAVCYRPPNTKYGQFSEMLRLLDSTLSDLSTPTPNICWMGDFNFPASAIQWHWVDGLLESIQSRKEEGALRYHSDLENFSRIGLWLRHGIFSQE